MRKSLIIYLLLLPLLLASSARVAAAVSTAGASSPWSDPVATASEILVDDNGVSVDNLYTGTARFDSVATDILAQLGLAHWSGKDAALSIHPPRFLLNRSFLI